MRLLLKNLLRLMIYINLILLVRSRRHLQGCTENLGNRDMCLTHYMSKSNKVSFMDNVALCNDVQASMFRPFNFSDLSVFASVHTNPVWIGAKQEGDGYYRWLSDGEGMFENYKGKTETLWKGGTTPTFTPSKKCLVLEAGKLNPWDCADASKANAVCEKCIVFDVYQKCKKKLCLCKNQANTVECMADCNTKIGCKELKQYSPLQCEVHGCTTNSFGPNCEFACNCKDETMACESRDGSCTGGPCREGWSGKSCNITRCEVGKWGPGCKKNCFCRNKQPCDAKSGYCSNGCLDSLGGPACTVDFSNTCKGKTFGKNCLQSCHCAAINSTCRPNGVCLESAVCEPNYAGPACNLGLCPPGKWGPRCQYYCACADGLPCDEKGVCPAGCKYSAVTGPSCNQTGCELGQWGSACAMNCSNCKKGNFCFANGSQQICEDDFVQHYKICYYSVGKFGPEGDECAFNCDATCTYCDPNTAGTKCVKTCPAFPDTYISTEEDCFCDEHCIHCDPDGICLRCRLWYDLDGALCVHSLGWLLVSGGVAMVLITMGAGVFFTMQPKGTRPVREPIADKNKEQYVERIENQDEQEMDALLEGDDGNKEGQETLVEEDKVSDVKSESSKASTRTEESAPRQT